MTLPNVPQDPTMTEPVRAWLERVKREIETALTSIDGLDVPAKATEAEAATGTNDTKFLTPLAGVAAIQAHSPFVKAAHFQHQETNGTEGGGSAATASATRTINTELYNEIGASLSSNQITLVAGSYFIWAAAVFHRTGRSRAWLYNVTDAAIELNGGCINAGDVSTAANSPAMDSVISGRFTIAGTKVFELRCGTNNGNGTSGFGYASDRGGNEIYSNTIIWKLD
jgi:hypothetical protein